MPTQDEINKRIAAIEEQMAKSGKNEKNDKGKKASVSQEDAKFLAEVMKNSNVFDAKEFNTYLGAAAIARQDGYLSATEVSYAREAAKESLKRNFQPLKDLEKGEKASLVPGPRKDALDLAWAYINNIEEAKRDKKNPRAVTEALALLSGKDNEHDPVLKAALAKRGQEATFDDIRGADKHLPKLDPAAKKNENSNPAGRPNSKPKTR